MAKYLPDNEFCVHPHVKEAYKNYNGDPAQFREALNRGKETRNRDHDDELKATAEERSRNPLFRFPK